MQSCLIGKDQRPICRDQPWRCISHPHATAGYRAYQQAFDRDELEILHLAKNQVQCGSAGPTALDGILRGLVMGRFVFHYCPLFDFMRYAASKNPYLHLSWLPMRSQILMIAPDTPRL